MQKSEDAVIFMQQNLDNIRLLFPEKLSLESLKNSHPDEPFSDDAIAFLNALSTSLMHNPEVRKYPDMATFAFFCRKANLLALKKEYATNCIRLGRGIVFHIAPSNVPVNFAYSLVAGILSGNTNLVRIPSKAFPQVDIICQSINQIAMQTEYSKFAGRIYLFRYDRQSEATATFSSICDVRIIWGGDDTIADVRKSPIPSRAYDLTFADRYSFCIINADAYITEQYPDKVAMGFFNDTYLFDQNACSAPRLVVWTGGIQNISKAKDKFWNSLQNVLTQKQYYTPEVIAVNKLAAFYLQAVGHSIHKEPAIDNRLWRVEWDDLPADIDAYRCAAGYFAEHTISSLDEVAAIVNRKYQTLAYYGYHPNELIEFVRRNKLNGIDRIVPIGKTTDFSLYWDGYDLIKSLSRIISVDP